MPTDLYPFYKGLLQRARRDEFEEDDDLQLAAQFAKEIVIKKFSKEEILVLVEKIIEVERPPKGTYYGKRMRRALLADDWVINVPYVKRHAWNEGTTDEGYLYVARMYYGSSDLSKLGATGADPEERLKKYRSRYGYSVEVYWRKKVIRPFGLESTLSKKFASFRHAGLTDGDSNE